MSDITCCTTRAILLNTLESFFLSQRVGLASVVRRWTALPTADIGFPNCGKGIKAMTPGILNSQEVNSKMFAKYLKVLQHVQKNHYSVDSAIHFLYNRLKISPHCRSTGKKTHKRTTRVRSFEVCVPAYVVFLASQLHFCPIETLNCLFRLYSGQSIA